MMHKARSILIAAGLLTTVAVVAAIGAATSFAQPHAGEHHAGLVIQFADGSTKAYCVSFTEDSITGLDALLKTGLDVKVEGYGGMGALVCQIGDEGCPYPEQPCVCQSYGPGGVYWSYHHLKSGKWKTATTGAAAYRLVDGDIDGWAWSTGSPPALVPAFSQVCASQGASPTSTVATSNTRKPPTPTHAAPAPTYTSVPPTRTRALATPTRRGASASPGLSRSTTSHQNPGAPSLPQPADTVLPTLTSSTPDKSDRAPSPQPTAVGQSTALPRPPSTETRASPGSRTPNPVTGPTLTRPSTAPTLAGPQPSVVPSLPVASPVSTRQDDPTAPIPVSTPVGTIVAKVSPMTQSATVDSRTSAPALPTSALQATARAVRTGTAVSTLSATVTTSSGAQPSASAGSLAQGIALVMGSVVLIGLSLWAVLRRRRSTRQGGS